MPVHFDLLTSADPSDLFVALTTDELQLVEGTAASADKRYVLLTRYWREEISDAELLRCVYTLRRNESKFELIDLDLLTVAPEAVELKFGERLADSSDANEYYAAEVPNNGVGLELETVCRHLVDGPVEGQVRKVRLCAFAMSMQVYDSMEALNSAQGLSRTVIMGDQEIQMAGLDEEFMAPGGALSPQDHRGEDDYHTVFVGHVLRYRTLEVDIGEHTLEFGQALVQSGAGKIPVLVNLDHPAASQLAEGKYVLATALIKAEFAVLAPGNYNSVSNSLSR